MITTTAAATIVKRAITTAKIIKSFASREIL